MWFYGRWGRNLVFVLAALAFCKDGQAQLSMSAPVMLDSVPKSSDNAWFTPKLAVNGPSRWLATWSVAEADNSTVRRHVRVIWSDDDGRTWSLPKNANLGAATLLPSAGDICAQADGKGRWLISVCGALGEFAAVPLALALSRDNGASWGASWPAPLSEPVGAYAGAQLRPSIETDAQGVWVCAWERQFSPSSPGEPIRRVCFATRSTDEGDSWSAPVALSSSQGAYAEQQASSPSLATDGKGHWVALWTGHSPSGGVSSGDVVGATSADNGATWSAPFGVHTDPTGQSISQYMSLATDKCGRWVAVWQKTTGEVGDAGSTWNLVSSISTDNGATWSVPTPITSDVAGNDKGNRNPCVDTDGAGQWVVVWSADHVGGASESEVDIRAAVSTDNGSTWSSPAIVDEHAVADLFGKAARPTVASDCAGRWVYLWVRNSTNPDTALLMEAHSSAGLWGRMRTNVAEPARDPSIHVTVEFSSPVSDFDASDIVPHNATVADFTGSGASYSFSLIAIRRGPVTADITAGTVHDGGSAPNESTHFECFYMPSDADGDGLGDVDELALGTDPDDPFDPASFPIATWPVAIALGGIGVRVLRRMRKPPCE